MFYICGVIQQAPQISFEELLTAFSQLKSQFALLKNENEQLRKRNQELEGKMLVAQHQITNYKRMIFGAKSERFIPEANPAQTVLPLDVETLGEAEVKSQEITYTRKEVTVKKNSNHKGRGLLPDHLRREVITLEPEENVEGHKVIGKEVTEVLECTPGEFYVIRYERTKYARPGNEGVITAPLPKMPLEKCMAGAYLLATILIDKYVFHLPLYRQMQKFHLAGIEIPKSTINDWVQRTGDQLLALYGLLIEKIFSSHYLMADETGMNVQDRNKKGTTHHGFYWVFHAPLENLVLFMYSPSRGRDGPSRMLKKYKGHLQTDGFQVYEEYDKQEGITLMHCMAHARRKFEQTLTSDKARAEYALGQFQLLYDIERRAREENYDHQQRYEIRQKESIPLFESMGAWLKENAEKVRPKSPIGKAIAYSLKRWDKLGIYCQRGFLEIDNNKIENAIRPVALGRKNYLFAGSHDAAQNAAMIYSFFAICKVKGINPYIWLSETLTKLAQFKGPQANLDQFLP